MVKQLRFFFGLVSAMGDERLVDPALYMKTGQFDGSALYKKLGVAVPKKAASSLPPERVRDYAEESEESEDEEDTEPVQLHGAETVPELKAACRELHLSTKGNKQDLEARLRDPDGHRVMVGGTSLKVTKIFDAVALRKIKAVYLRLGHPQSANIQRWIDAVQPVAPNVSAVALYTLSGVLGSKDGPDPLAFPNAAASDTAVITPKRSRADDDEDGGEAAAAPAKRPKAGSAGGKKKYSKGGSGVYTPAMDAKGGALYKKVGKACKETIEQYLELFKSDGPDGAPLSQGQIYGHNKVFAERAKALDSDGDEDEEEEEDEEEDDDDDECPLKARVEFLKAKADSFAVGVRVELQFDDGEWYKGVIQTVNSRRPPSFKPTVDILFDDGDEAKAVPLNHELRVEK